MRGGNARSSQQIHDLVKLPLGTDKNEWMAKLVCELTDEVEKLYGTVTEYCTTESCPVMTAGPGWKYLWREKDDDETEQLCARGYISRVLEWAKRILDSEEIFPNEIGRPFPDDFEDKVKKLMSRLFRIYAHCYWYHQEHFKALNTLEHLNFFFTRFIWFAREFDLIGPAELDPIKNIVDKAIRGDLRA